MKKQATVHITKIAAAKRQLEAAIRMFFTREDELAIHTVAAAAFRVLRDIKGKRGSSFAADVMKEALYDFTRRYMEGTLRADEVEHLKAAGLLPFIISLVGRINSDGGKFDREQISVQMDFQAEQRMFPSAVANFLKHADRDVGAHLVEEVKNLDLLIRATAAYLQLIKDRSPELTVFRAG
jgi:hypothetical protein